MKKIIFIVLAIVYSLHASSQDTGVRFGLTVSPQISWMSSGDNGLEGNGSYVGFNYGLLNFFTPSISGKSF